MASAVARARHDRRRDTLAVYGGAVAPVVEVGGGALLEGEANGFAADFLYATDAQRVAVKTAGTVVSSGTSFFTSSGTSPKWVYNSAGVLVNIPVGTLPFDYDPVTHAARGLLVEPQATNLLLNNATLSTQSVTVTATGYTLSIFGTGTVTLTGTSTAGPLVGTGANNRVFLTFTPIAGSLTLTVSGNVTKGQLETGPVATSTIPTLGASVTRAADVYTGIAASMGYSATAGSWWVETYLQNGAGNENIIGTNSGIGTPLFYNNTAFSLYEGSQLYQLGPNIVNNVAKAISAFQSGDRAITFNGLAPATDAGASALMRTPTTIYFGNSVGGGPMFGYIRKVRYLPRRPTNVEVQAMTA